MYKLSGDVSPADQTTLSGQTVLQSPGFVHPGILNSTSNLNFITSDSSPARLLAFNQITEAIDNFLPFPASFPSMVYVRTPPHKVTDTELQMWNDSILAYAYALRWARTGDAEDADHAKYILNGWAANFQQIKGCTANDPPSETGCPGVGTDSLQRRLQAAWAVPNFAAAAEIIRHYEVNGNGAGWPEANIAAFKKFLEKLHVDYVETLVQGIQPGGTGWAANNWGASGVWAKMAVAIFTDNRAWYNDAAAKAKHAIYNIAQPSGEVAECERANYSDCSHPQMSLTALTYAAETANIQGDSSIYEAHSQRLNEGWKWISGAYHGAVSCQNTSFSCTSQDNILPGVEVARDYYGLLDHSSKNIGDLRTLQAPYGLVTRQFIGFTSYTHHP